MASFAGTDLGFIFSMNVAANPKGRQINVYPGANGLEVIDQGSRGGRTTVEGGLIGGNASSLNSAEGNLRAWQVDGGAYVLIDTLGAVWLDVIMVMFQPVGPVRQLVGGGVGRRYQAEFLHIT